MKRNMVVVLVVVVVVVVVSGLFSARRFVGLASSGGGKPETDVKLSIQPNGVCGATAPVGDLGGGWLYKIRWNVTNYDCDQKQYVAFLQYQERIGTTLGPIDGGIVDPDPAYSKQLGRGDSDKVDGRIEKLHFNLSGTDKVYKYKICVGPNPKPTTNCLDPDVDVWPY